MNLFEIFKLAEYGMFEDSIFSPLFLITQINGRRISGHPVFFGDSLACSDDIKLKLEEGSYRDIWVDSTLITIHEASCLKKVGDMDDRALGNFMNAKNNSGSALRGRRYLEGIDPLEKMKLEMKDFFLNYSEKSFAHELESIPEIIKKGIKNLLAFDSIELVTQQASGGNKVESRIVEKNSVEINYSLERRLDQDGDLVISINGRANIRSAVFRIWLVLAKESEELFRKEISVVNGHFEEYYYRDELTDHALDPESIMEQLEKGTLKCYLIIDSGIQE